MFKHLFALFVLMFVALPLSAQVKVTGKVTDQDNSPLPGASIVVKGTAKGVSSDFDGNYEIQAKEGDVLEFSFVGFQPQTKKVVGGGKSLIINVLLKEDAQQLEDVVVVGYGTQKKENLTGAVAAISAEDLNKRPVTNPQTMLQGQVPGLRIVQGTGQPGAENVQIRVRGQGTYSTAGSDPLVLIDGVPGYLSSLNPNDIENISVLKDAASAAIYGSRAANGVILVTTKSGSDGTFKVEYTNNFAIHTPTKMLDIVTNSAEYMRLFNEARTNSGVTGLGIYSDEMISAYENATDRTKYPNFNWVDYMFNPAFVQTHNVSLSGGAKGTTYNIGLGYVDQPGTMRGFNYEKMNFRLNLKSEIKPWVTVGANIGLERDKQKQPRQGQSDSFLSTLSQAPTYAPFLPDGRYVMKAYSFEENNKNMVAIVENGVLRKTISNEVNAQLWADLTLMKGLHLYSKMAVNYSDTSEKDWRPVIPQYYFHTGDPARNLDVGEEGLVATDYKNLYTNFFSYLKYETSFNESHNVGLQVGYSQEQNTYGYLSGYRQRFLTNELQELDAGTVAIQTNGGYTTEWALQSVFGRFNYDYKGRYLLEANLRYDGTSRIAKDNRWGVFPSFSAGWRLTEEEFIKNADISWLNNVKIRGSYGKLGNQNIYLGDDVNYPYAYQALLSFTGDYSFDNATLSPGIARTALASDLIQWESTAVTDIGVDLTLFKGLSITYDYYKKHTYDILRTAQVTDLVGMYPPYVNKGDMINIGHEIAVQYNGVINSGKMEGFSYGVGFYIDTFRNKLTNFGTREIGSYVIREEGLPYNSYYMLEKIGVFQNQADIDNSPKQFSDKVSPGDFKYRDANGDGVVNDNDRVVVSGRFPKYEYSFNANIAWKGFDLSALFQGVQGRKVYVRYWGYEPFLQGSAPTRDFVNNRWTGEGSTNEYPKLYYYGYSDSQNRRPNTHFLQDASYLRLKNLTFGFTFPTEIVNKYGIAKARIYFSGDNLFTITNYKGLDPERSTDGRFAEYPQNKIVSMGLNIEL